MWIVPTSRRTKSIRLEMTLPSGISNAHYLSWDSEFFGVQTAIIQSRQLDAGSLSQLLESLWSSGMELVYWAADPDYSESSNAALVCDGLHVDTKIVYGKKVIVAAEQAPSEHIFEDYDVLSDYDADLEEIAADCGQFSRFQFDPRISEERRFELYRTWIRNSINRSIADNVIVAKTQGKISGLVTVVGDSGTGSIGLLGVGKAYRGRGVGSVLINAAMKWFAMTGCPRATVVTQARNRAAC